MIRKLKTMFWLVLIYLGRKPKYKRCYLCKSRVEEIEKGIYECSKCGEKVYSAKITRYDKDKTTKTEIPKGILAKCHCGYESEVNDFIDDRQFNNDDMLHIGAHMECPQCGHKQGIWI